jgi:predicted RNase H-related nuclease YkuK (DUF458 family)
MTNTIADIEKADVILVTGVQHHRESSGAVQFYETGRVSKRGQAHRGRSQAHQA